MLICILACCFSRIYTPEINYKLCHQTLLKYPETCHFNLCNGVAQHTVRYLNQQFNNNKIIEHFCAIKRKRQNSELMDHLLWTIGCRLRMKGRACLNALYYTTLVRSERNLFN